MNLRCLFGHAKEYVAVKANEWVNVFVPPIFLETYKGSKARWVCKRNGCNAMGEDTFKGAMAIYCGKIVPDHKAWANWECDS